jgi:general secretion pathway protein A
MYTEYFGLKEKPFSITPDPGYFYISENHREALGHLLYALNGDGGFVLLTGEVGTGKTTVCRRLLQQVPDNCDVAFILYPRLTGEELLVAICDEFGISREGDSTSSRALVARIYDYLVKTHESRRKAVLIVEEAQNLSNDVLEQIRLLTNLETNKQKLLQVILLGQPELRDRLAQPELVQLRQRITARYHLGSLSFEDINGYVNHRLSVAGLPRAGLFPRPVLRDLYRLTRGVPRLINVICDRALTGAYIQGNDRVDRRTLRAAAREVSGDYTLLVARWKRVVAVIGIFAVLSFVSVGVIHFVPAKEGPKKPAPVTIVGQEKETDNSRGRVVVPLPKQPRLDSRESIGSLKGLGNRADKENAMHVLAVQWGVNISVKTVSQACRQLEGRGLACLEGKESLDAVKAMDKPAVMRIQDEDGEDGYVVLSAVEGQRATLHVGNTVKVVDTKELSRRWLGEYLLLWRLPPGHKEEVRVGDEGPLVSWMVKQLAMSEGTVAERGTAGRVYTREIAQKVRQFQVNTGLVPDGLIGPKTLIRLGNVSESRDPSLTIHHPPMAPGGQ